jgi:hypothetical protein
MLRFDHLPTSPPRSDIDRGVRLPTTRSLKGSLSAESLVAWYPGLKDLLLQINDKLPNVAGASHELRALRLLLSKQNSEAEVLRLKFPVTYLFHHDGGADFGVCRIAEFPLGEATHSSAL